MVLIELFDNSSTLSIDSLHHTSSFVGLSNSIILAVKEQFSPKLHVCPMQRFH